NWSSFSGRRLPFLSTTRPILIRPRMGGVMARPLIMACLLDPFAGICGFKKKEGIKSRKKRQPSWCWVVSGLHPKAAAARRDQGVLFEQFRLVLEQGLNVQPPAVLAALPGNLTLRKERPRGIAQGLLKRL